MISERCELGRASVVVACLLIGCIVAGFVQQTQVEYANALAFYTTVTSTYPSTLFTVQTTTVFRQSVTTSIMQQLNMDEPYVYIRGNIRAEPGSYGDGFVSIVVKATVMNLMSTKIQGGFLIVYAYGTRGPLYLEFAQIQPGQTIQVEKGVFSGYVSPGSDISLWAYFGGAGIYWDTKLIEVPVSTLTYSTTLTNFFTTTYASPSLDVKSTDLIVIVPLVSLAALVIVWGIVRRKMKRSSSNA